MEKRLDGKSFDNVRARIEELKRLFPEAVKEGHFDPELLLGLLEENDETYGLNDERYDFTWKGKAEALRLAQRRSDGTLRPCFEESRDWDTTQNLYIEGDNLEVMKLLQQGYLRSVKMIYIDPPYNTGNDFVYQDDFADPIAKYKEATGQGMRANPETAGRYHSNWLSMMYPRLKIAKTLLRDDGVIFISIDDNEVHNLRKLCDDVFGEDCFLACLLWEKTRKNDARFFSTGHEYILVYARNESYLRENNLYWREAKPGAREIFSEYERLRGIHGDDFTAMEKGLKQFYAELPKEHPAKKHARYNKVDERGVWRDDNLSWPGGDGPTYDVLHPETGQPCKVPAGGWRFPTPERMQEMIANGTVVFRKDHTEPPIRKSYLVRKLGRLSEDGDEDIGKQVMGTYFYRSALQATNTVAELLGNRVFDYPKDHEILMRLISYVTDKDDVVLDFFSGSGTTAHAVMQLNAESDGNRKFICIQLAEPIDERGVPGKKCYHNIADIGKERIRRAGDKIYGALASGAGRGDGSGYGMGSGCGAGTGDGSGGDEEKRVVDIGFRVFKLDSSNLQKWDGSYVPPENANLFLDRAEHSLDNMKPDRRDIDMVYEVFLKYGVPLTEKLSTLQIQGKTFYVVGDTGYLMICPDKGITVEIVEETVKVHTPGAIIFADECFVDDNELTNSGLVLDKAQIEFRWI